MVPHQINQIVAFQAIFKETLGLTNTNGYGYNNTNKKEPMNKDYVGSGATMTGQGQGEIASFQNMLKQTLGLIS